LQSGRISTEGTDGLLYGVTNAGGADGNGVFFSLNVGFAPFITLQSTSGKVGAKVGILGQGFSSSSVVKFNGVSATTVTRSGTTYLTATVPTGASSGFVTVTTGTTTLTSTQKFTVHDSWGSGAAMTTGVQWPMTGTIGSKIYVVGGYTATVAVANNQIYNPTTNTWSSGAALPTAMAQGATAVVNNVLYVFGGSADGGGTVTNAVWAYTPSTNSWASRAAMPTARCSSVSVVEKGIAYVIGGYNGSRLNTVESYNPTTNTWTEEAPLLVGKSEISAGLISTTIVASGGFASGGVTGDTEGYNATANTWTTLATDSVHRNGACAGAIGGNLYASDGNDNSNNAFSVNESFNLTKNAWTTLTAMPQIVTDSGPAVYNGQLYCFGGSSFANAFRGTVYNNVQIYQP
jgi:N-acetylneuraminic acid mutarotase